MATTAAPRKVEPGNLRKALLRSGRTVMADSSGDNRKVFAEGLVDLREQYTDADGRLDYAGRSKFYRDEVQAIYSEIGLGESDPLRTGIRYHVQKIVRERLLREASGDAARYAELCRQYGFKPQHSDDLRKTRARLSRVSDRGLVTAEDAVAFLADTRGKTERFLRANDLQRLSPSEAESLCAEMTALMETLAPVVATIDVAGRKSPVKKRRKA